MEETHRSRLYDNIKFPMAILDSEGEHQEKPTTVSANKEKVLL